MKYLRYDIENYLTDTQFQDWVKHPTAEKNAFWNEWMEAHPAHRAKIGAAREVLWSMRFHHLENSHEDYQEVLQHILQGKKSSRGQGIALASAPAYRLLAHPFLSRAAILLLCLLGAWGWNSYENRMPTSMHQLSAIQYKVVKNPQGIRSTVTLPDGSTVLLNADSKITFAEAFSDSLREVHLQGEAYFEVSKDTARPFIVRTFGMHTRVLGTSFNVNAYDDKQTVEVSLLEGKVEVALNNNGAQKLRLVPGEKATYHGGVQKIKKGTYDYHRDVSWKDGEIYFENASFREVSDRLEKWYDVEFMMTEGLFEAWHYNGAFKNSSIDKVMERLAYVQNFSYEIQGKKIYINFKR